MSRCVYCTAFAVLLVAACDEAARLDDVDREEPTRGWDEVDERVGMSPQALRSMSRRRRIGPPAGDEPWPSEALVEYDIDHQPDERERLLRYEALVTRYDDPVMHDDRLGSRLQTLEEPGDLPFAVTSSIVAVRVDDFAHFAAVPGSSVPGGMEWDLAVEAAARYCDRRTDGVNFSGGCVLLMSNSKDYWTGGTIDLCTSVILRGGGRDTRLRARGHTAIRIYHRFEDCPLPFQRDVMPSVTVESLSIHGQPTGDEPVFGIETGAPAHLRDLWVQGFVQNLRIRCSLIRSADGNWSGRNCNGTRVVRFSSHLAEHAGVYVGGADANVISFDNLSSDTSCRQASRWNDRLMSAHCRVYGDRPECAYQCANVINESFLGNTFVAAHTAHAYDSTAGTWYPNVLDLGLNAQNTWVGTYCETGTLLNWLSPRSNVFGGICRWEQQYGGQFTGPRLNGFVSWNREHPDPRWWVETRVGVHAGKNAFMSMAKFREHGGSGSGRWLPELSPLRFQSDPDRGHIYTDRGNCGTRQLVFRDQEDGCQGGQLQLPDEVHSRYGPWSLLEATQCVEQTSCVAP